MLRSLLYFLIAGICEIGGGYLVWLSLREQRGIFYFIAGAAVLVLYGIVPTFQPASFEKVYAAYGGVFIVLSLLWGLWVDGHIPDRFDCLGALCASSVSGLLCTRLVSKKRGKENLFPSF